MTTLDTIKNKIKELYSANPNIHLSISSSMPRISLENEPVVIKGVYPHMFQIVEYSSGHERCHTLPYTAVLTRHIQIAELEDI